MHCTFLFFSFICISFVRTLFLSFLLSLSLSLSFSLLLMAPKKSVPSKSPICHGSSSSSSFPPESLRFCDEKARDDFFENFYDQVIHSERQVILSNFSNTPLPCVLSSQEWASLREKP